MKAGKKPVDNFFQALFRARGALLLPPLFLLLAGFWLAGHPLSLGYAARITALLFIVCAIAFLHLRHFWLSALVVVTPLIGLLAISIGGPTVAPSPCAYGLGLIVALFAADAIAAGMANETATCVSSIAVLHDLWRVVASVIVIAIAGTIAMCWWGPYSAGELAMSFAIAALGGCLLSVFAVPALHYGEGFIVAFNRTREREERMLFPVASVSIPRWAFSISGIAVVVSTLGYFGYSAGSPISLAVWLPTIAVLISALAALLWLLRDWRAALGALAANVPSILSYLWVTRLAGDPAIGLELVLLNLAPGLFLAWQVRSQAREEPETGGAYQRAIERKGGTATTAAIMVAATMGLAEQSVAIALVFLVFSVTTSVVFQPAISTAIESLFLRREVIAARYRVG